MRRKCRYARDVAGDPLESGIDGCSETVSEIALPTWQLFVSRDSECDHCRDRQNNEWKQGEAESDPLLSPPPSGRCPCSLGCHLQRRLSISRTTTTSHASNGRPVGRSSPGTFVLAPECRQGAAGVHGNDSPRAKIDTLELDGSLGRELTVDVVESGICEKYRPQLRRRARSMAAWCSSGIRRRSASSAAAESGSSGRVKSDDMRRRIVDLSPPCPRTVDRGPFRPGRPRRCRGRRSLRSTGRRLGSPCGRRRR